MTPLQFAARECANYRGGQCSGVNIHDDGSLAMFRKPGGCCYLASGQACTYFEQCVLPMGIERNSAIGERRAWERDEASHAYRTQMMAPGAHSGRLCPGCRKRELQKGCRLCPACRMESEKTKHAARQARYRAARDLVETGKVTES